MSSQYRSKAVYRSPDDYRAKTFLLPKHAEPGSHTTMLDHDSIALAVVESVAEREGVDPVALEPPLHSVVDPEALEALFRSTNTTERMAGTIQFDYCGYTVHVDASGTVHLTEAVDPREARD